MSQYLLYNYLPAFANTVLAELGVAVLVGFWSLRQLGAIVLVNLVSHPALHVVLWAAFWCHQAVAPMRVLFELELAVVVVEGILLRIWLRVPPGKAFGLSAAMNTISYLIGLAIAVP